MKTKRLKFMKGKSENMLFDRIICGGTFDTLHAGHKAFLLFAFQNGKHVVIGLTSDAFIAKQQKANVQPFIKRKKSLEEFLEKENVFKRAKIVEINSKFDQTQIPDSARAALLVSYETYPVGLEINKERVQKGLLPLDLLVFPLVGSDISRKISSSDIREGIITPQGMLLPPKELMEHTLLLPSFLRKTLQMPYGTLLKKDIPEKFLSHPETLVTVGDRITKRIHSLGIQQKLAVVDFRVERKDTNETLVDLGFTGQEEVVSLENSQGTVGSMVWDVLLKAVQLLPKKNVVITVVGEDDLLVIPLILLLPLGFTVLYGQPGEGVVAVEITEEIKRQTYSLLMQFKRA